MRAMRGFTLLELLVVLVLVALVTGLAAPAALRSLDAARERGFASDLSATLAALPAQAFAGGQALSLDAQALRQRLPEALPPDWALSLPQPLQYGANGVARGGEVLLQPPGRPLLRWQVRAFDGVVTRRAGD